MDFTSGQLATLEKIMELARHAQRELDNAPVKPSKETRRLRRVRADAIEQFQAILDDADLG